MDVYFSVFNGHKNNADKRARELMSRECPDALAEVEKIEREEGGIMAIFHCAPCFATATYAGAVFAYVNELQPDTTP